MTKAAGGAFEGAQDLAENIGFWLPALTGAVLRPKVGVGITPEEVRVGAAIKPPGMEPMGRSVEYSRAARAPANRRQTASNLRPSKATPNPLPPRRLPVKFSKPLRRWHELNKPRLWRGEWRVE